MEKSGYLQCRISNENQWKNKGTWDSLKNKTKSKEIPFKGNPKQIANDMNNFFVNHASQLTKNKLKSNLNNCVENKASQRIFQLKNLSTEQLKSIIKNMKNKDSSGKDGISNSLIKKTCDEIIEPLKLIINNSLKTGTFPDSLKTAVIVPIYGGHNRPLGRSATTSPHISTIYNHLPIYKGGDETCYNNSRPICILTSFSKIFEVAYCNQLMEFLLKEAFFKANYRPISILTSFSKIFEVAYCNQLMEFLLKEAFFKANYRPISILLHSPKFVK